MRAHRVMTMLNVVVLLVAPTGADAAGLFTGLGSLRPGLGNAGAYDASADGSVVVGACPDVNAQGFDVSSACLWTATGGWQVLIPAPLFGFAEATAVSADGATVVGNLGLNGQAFRWTAAGGAVGLIDPQVLSYADDVSADGSVVAGAEWENAYLWRAFRWTADSGAVPIGPIGAQGAGISADGSVIVGDGPSYAFRWTAETGMLDLGALPGSENSSGTNVSPDGSIAVGMSFRFVPPYYTNALPVRWMSDGSVEALELLPGMEAGEADAIADGSIIVGSQAIDPAGNGDVAFIWDPVRRSRLLQDVFEHDYGFDLTGWHLNAATAISRDGRVILGYGVHPNDEYESWLAILPPASPPACSDGADNDGDGLTDYPADPGCASPTDPSEGIACSDGIDNDGDGVTDYPADPGCSSEADDSERSPALVCDDGVDDDGDGVADYPADAGCSSPIDDSETSPTLVCDDGVDDDGDGLIDFRANGSGDPGCSSPTDGSEKNPTLPCDDGIDNDADTLIDYPADPGCTSPLDSSESGTAACDDGIDNDGDGLADYPADPGCSSVIDDSEKSPALACDDGVDNDADGRTDYPNDPGCSSPADDSEKSPALVCDDGVDNDGDGRVDHRVDASGDLGCASPTDASETSPTVACDDGIDNDGDGLVDYRVDGSGDPGCHGPTQLAIENPDCQDGIDNDRDGQIDFDGGASANHGIAKGSPDPDCTTPYRWTEVASCGLGAELVLIVPVLACLRRSRVRSGDGSGRRGNACRPGQLP